MIRLLLRISLDLFLKDIKSRSSRMTYIEVLAVWRVLLKSFS